MSIKSKLPEITASICERENLALHEHVPGGAFKHVFRVETATGQSLALKIIEGPSTTGRTEREIDALRRCDHVNIAKLIKVGDCPDRKGTISYILEEYLSGGTLTSRCRDRGRLSISETAALGGALIEAIAHIASLGLVHRDIKPDNVMFRSDGCSPVLVDFNLVRDLSAASLTQSWLNQGPGTPYFAAPEQLNNQKALIDWRTDQFSLGVTLCHAHLGVHPYQHPSEPQLSPQTVERVATRGERNRTLLETLGRAGLTCLEKMTNAWPVQRYRQPHELQLAWKSMGDR